MLGARQKEPDKLGLIQETPDLRSYPEKELANLVLQPNSQFTIGDLHGNALKLIYFLVRQGILVLDKKDYGTLAQIYENGDNPTQLAGNLAKFKEIINKATFHPNARSATIRLIGDELADRGVNDYLTLLLLKKLRDHKIPVEIMISNHSIEFLEACEKSQKGGKLSPPRLRGGHAHSMVNLQRLIDLGSPTQEEVLELAQTSYKPTLKVISYHLSDDKKEITLFSHAPIDVETIQHMARKLAIPETKIKIDNAENLAKTIDEINEIFSRRVAENRVNELYTDQAMLVGYGGELISKKEEPFAYSMWNREYNNLDRSTPFVRFAHGHDSSGVTTDRIFNLDSILGKSLAHLNEGSYAILHQQGPPAPMLELTASTEKAREAANAMSDHHLQVDALAGVVSQNLQGPYAIKKNGAGFWTFDAPQVQVRIENLARVQVLSGLDQPTSTKLLQAMIAANTNNSTNKKKGTNLPINQVEEVIKELAPTLPAGVLTKVGEGGFRWVLETLDQYKKRMSQQIDYLINSLEGGAEVLCFQEQPYESDADKVRRTAFHELMEAKGYTQKKSLASRDVGIWVKASAASEYQAVTNPALNKLIEPEPLRGCLLEKKGYIYANLHAYTQNVSPADYVNKLIAFKQALEAYAKTQNPPSEIVLCGDLNLFQLEDPLRAKLESGGFVLELVKGQQELAEKKRAQEIPFTPSYEAFVLPAETRRLALKRKVEAATEKSFPPPPPVTQLISEQENPLLLGEYREQLLSCLLPEPKYKITPEQAGGLLKQGGLEDALKSYNNSEFTTAVFRRYLLEMLTAIKEGKEEWKTTEDDRFSNVPEEALSQFLNNLPLCARFVEDMKRDKERNTYSGAEAHLKALETFRENAIRQAQANTDLDLVAMDARHKEAYSLYRQYQAALDKMTIDNPPLPLDSKQYQITSEQAQALLVGGLEQAFKEYKSENDASLSAVMKKNLLTILEAIRDKRDTWQPAEREARAAFYLGKNNTPIEALNVFLNSKNDYENFIQFMEADKLRNPGDPGAAYLKAFQELRDKLIACSLANELQPKPKKEEELVAQKFPYKQMVEISTEGNNCPVYCVAQHLLTEVFKFSSVSSEKDKKQALLHKLAQGFNHYLNLKLTPDALYIFLKGLERQDPMMAMNAMSDMLIAVHLKTNPRDVQNMLGDEIFKVLAKDFNLNIRVYNNPPGVSKNEAGSQLPGADQTISLRQIGSYGPPTAASPTVNIYHLADDSSTHCGYCVSTAKITLPAANATFSELDRKALAANLPPSVQQAYVLVQESGDKKPKAFCFVDKTKDPPFVKLLKGEIEESFLKNLNTILGAPPVAVTVPELSADQLARISANTGHSLAKHQHFNLLLPDEERVNYLNLSTNLEVMEQSPSLGSVLTPPNLPEGRNNAIVLVQPNPNKPPTEVYFVYKGGKEPVVKKLACSDMTSLVTALFPGSATPQDIRGLRPEQLQIIKNKTEDFASVATEYEVRNKLASVAEERRAQLSCLAVFSAALDLHFDVEDLISEIEESLSQAHPIEESKRQELNDAGTKLLQIQAQLAALLDDKKLGAAKLVPAAQLKLPAHIKGHLITIGEQQQKIAKLAEPKPIPTPTPTPTLQSKSKSKHKPPSKPGPAASISLSLQPAPKRSSRLAKNPKTALAEKTFSTVPADESLKSEYVYYKPASQAELNQLKKQVQTELNVDAGLAAASSSQALPSSGKSGTVRVGKHSIPPALIDKGAIVKEFSIIESNKSASSVNSDLIFTSETEVLMKSKQKFSELSDNDKKVLLMVVDKQVADGIETLNATGKTVTLTLNPNVSPLMQEAYTEYCKAMSLKLKDNAQNLLVSGKEEQATLKIKREDIEAQRAAFVELAKKEKTKSLTSS